MSYPEFNLDYDLTGRAVRFSLRGWSNSVSIEARDILDEAVAENLDRFVGEMMGNQTMAAMRSAIQSQLAELVMCRYLWEVADGWMFTAEKYEEDRDSREAAPKLPRIMLGERFGWA